MTHHQMAASRKAGAWLCAEGPYLEVISNMGTINPGILSSDPKNGCIGSRIGQSRTVLLEHKSNTIEWSCIPFGSVTSLKDHFKARKDQLDHQSEPTLTTQRIYILEGLDPEYVEAYGSQFAMDPMFFVGQERHELWNSRDVESHTDDPALLPSAVQPDERFRVKYREVRDFGPQLKDWRTTCALTGRHIAAIGFNGKLDSVGAIARRMSYWSEKDPDGSVDVLILCDPDIKIVQKPHRPWVQGQYYTEVISSKPYQGGYSDFIHHSPHKFTDSTYLQGPPRTSLMDDVCFYIKHHPSSISSPTRPHDGGRNFTAAILPMRIICGHYMKLISYFEVIIYRLAQAEWQLSRQSDYGDYDVPASEEQWSSFHVSRGRLTAYIEDLEETIKDITFQSGDTSVSSEWISITKDLQYIHQRLEKMKCKIDESIASAIGFSNIIGSQQALLEARRSVREAKRTKTLTVVGLIFIPLAYTCGLFSMSDQFRPGERLFWVYFVVSLPLILLVFLVTFLMQFGYDDTGNIWSLRQFKIAFKEKVL